MSLSATSAETRPADLIDRIDEHHVVVDGENPIQQFREHGPDITLMDLQMPAMTGLEAMVAIRKEFPEAKVIILTTYAADVEGALKLCARAYLQKTELDQELLPTIRAVYSGS